MKTATRLSPLLALLSLQPALGQEPLLPGACSTSTDRGTEVRIAQDSSPEAAKQSPLGPETKVVAYANALAIHLLPDRIARFGYAGQGTWVAFEGNPNERKLTTTGTGAVKDSLWDRLDLVKRGNVITIALRNAPETKLIRFTLPEPGSGTAAPIESTVELESRGGASLARLTSRIPLEEQAQGERAIDVLPKDQRKVVEERSRKLKYFEAPAAHADFTPTSNDLVRTGCGSGVSDLTGGQGGASPPSSDVPNTTARSGG